MEEQTSKTNIVNKLEVFETRVYCRIFKMPWTPTIRNEEVYRTPNRGRELFTTVKKNKTAYFGHIIGNSKF